MTPGIAIELETQGAKRRRSPAVQAPVQHKDKLDQDILIDQFVVFSSSYNTGVAIGRVVKLTPQRIRVEARSHYTDRNGIPYSHTYQHTPRPNEVIVLTDALLPHLTMMALKGSI